MKVGFLNNQIDNRGTGNALFDYAHYNEEILGNESIIMSLDTSPRDTLMYDRIMNRFGAVYNGSLLPQWKVDVVYHIKSGAKDWYRPPEGVRYAVHAVFDYQPHGDRYAVVSPWMGRVHNAPYVPHIVNLPSTTENLRGRLAIPEDAIVFGRYGGADSFDIPFVWSAINRAIKANPNVWFLFMNTNCPIIDFYDPSRLAFLGATASSEYKRKFINTCDAMLHARQRGETFGIAVGEFAVCNKPVLSYSGSPEQNHFFDTLPYLYRDEEELYEYLTQIQWLKEDQNLPINYKNYTPEKVMAKFKEVFLDD